MKRLFVLVLCVTVAAALGARGSQEKGGAAAKPVTVRIGCADTNVPDLSLKTNLATFKVLQQKLNIVLDWDVVKSDYDNVMKTRLAAMSDLPDVIAVPGGENAAVKYGNDGVLLEIGPLMDKAGPNMKAFFTNVRPDVRKSITAPDGKMYFSPSNVLGLIQGKSSNEALNPTILGYRADWLKKLKLNPPTTMDELHAVLKAIKTGDPNGNGKQDEIPLYFLRSAQQALSLWSLSGAYGLHLDGDDYYTRDGKVVNEWFLPEARQYVQLIASWYAEGLMDNQCFIKYDSAKWMASVQNSLVGFSFMNMGHIPSWTAVLRKTVPEGTIWPLEQLPKGPTGLSSQMTEQPFGGAYGITKLSKNPEAAMRYLDYFYSTEGQLLFEFGIPGESYEMKDGKPVYSQAIIDRGKQVGNFAYEKQRMGIHTNGSVWILTHQGRGQEFSQQYVGDLLHLSGIAGRIAERSVPRFPFILATAAEESEFTRIRADIETYKTEMLAKFILGTESMAKWDEFLAKLKSMNVDRLIQIRQQQYDRVSKG